jgi:hypothetical protein
LIEHDDRPVMLKTIIEKIFLIVDRTEQ